MPKARMPASAPTSSIASAPSREALDRKCPWRLSGRQGRELDIRPSRNLALEAVPGLDRIRGNMFRPIDEALLDERLQEAARMRVRDTVGLDPECRAVLRELGEPPAIVLLSMTRARRASQPGLWGRSQSDRAREQPVISSAFSASLFTLAKRFLLI